MLNLSLQQKFLQKLSPQQVQYLKLLQLPALVLEQRIKAEIELNPLLEEGTEEELEMLQESPETADEPQSETATEAETTTKSDDSYSLEDYMNDDNAGYKAPEAFSTDEDDDKTEMPSPSRTSLAEHLLDQLRMLNITEEEFLLGEEIIGNIDEDGYLRRELNLILQDLNLTHGFQISLEAAEKVLKKIQSLDPVGIGSRTLQECLLAQLNAMPSKDRVHQLTLIVVEKYFEEFTMKHFEDLAKKLGTTLDELKTVLDVIQKLNPKPGEGEFTAQENYIIPDFIVQDVEGEPTVLLNDRSIPPLRINKAYRELISRKKKNGVSKETKNFIRQNFEAAKWFITSLHQRRETMLRVMRAIVEKQKQFFIDGEGLKPLIYKDIASIINMDISTISRVVNGKYVQTDYGVYELRYFFSDGISTQSGENVANKEVKKILKELIDVEDHLHPLSDDELVQRLNQMGYNIARRTVAKYRESMMIPVARLRRKIS
ncbi:MAG: RNA polymerase factor sigma-54 [Bacteroidota bacterium]